MKVLLDEDLPHLLRHHLPGHTVVTVSYAGYSSLKNGRLIEAAERDGFEVLVTGDRGIEYRQNFSKRTLARVALSAQEWPILKKHLDAIAGAVDRAVSGSYEYVECGKFRRGER